MNESVEERTSHGSDKPASDQLLAVLRGSDVLQRSMVFSTSMLLGVGSVSPEASFASESHNEGGESGRAGRPF